MITPSLLSPQQLVHWSSVAFPKWLERYNFGYKWCRSRRVLLPWGVIHTESTVLLWWKVFPVAAAMVLVVLVMVVVAVAGDDPVVKWITTNTATATNVTNPMHKPKWTMLVGIHCCGAIRFRVARWFVSCSTASPRPLVVVVVVGVAAPPNSTSSKESSSSDS